MTPLQSWIAMLILLVLAFSPWIMTRIVDIPKADEEDHCSVCNDRADFGAWDLPACATPLFCRGCGGLVGFED